MNNSRMLSVQTEKTMARHDNKMRFCLAQFERGLSKVILCSKIMDVYIICLNSNDILGRCSPVSRPVLYLKIWRALSVEEYGSLVDNTASCSQTDFHWLCNLFFY